MNQPVSRTTGASSQVKVPMDTKTGPDVVTWSSVQAEDRTKLCKWVEGERGALHLWWKCYYAPRGADLNPNTRSIDEWASSHQPPNKCRTFYTGDSWNSCVTQTRHCPSCPTIGFTIATDQNSLRSNALFLLAFSITENWGWLSLLTTTQTACQVNLRHSTCPCHRVKSNRSVERKRTMRGEGRKWK